MALFKIFKGPNSSKLTDKTAPGYLPIIDGYCYFDTSIGLFYIDSDDKRAPINAMKAVQDIDGKQIDTTYLKKSIGTTKGDIIYWSSNGVPTRLGIGTPGQVLSISENGVPQWGGSVDVANKLAHSLTIGPYVFDGSQDITVPIYDGTSV